MAIKVFTQEQLNASDLNAFASKGDTFIKSAAVTTGQILNCFSSTFQNYRIVISDYQATTSGYLWMQLGFNSGATYLGGNYFQGGAYVGMGSPFTIVPFNNNNTLPYWRIMAGDTSANLMNTAFMTISRPFTTNPTEYSCHTTLIANSFGLFAWHHAGKQNSSQFCDSIRWSADTGSVAAGTVTVYGINQT